MGDSNSEGYNSILEYLTHTVLTSGMASLAVVIVTLPLISLIFVLVQFGYLPRLLVRLWFAAVIGWGVYSANEMLTGRVNTVDSDEYPDKRARRINRVMNIVYHNLIVMLAVLLGFSMFRLTGTGELGVLLTVFFAPLYHELAYHRSMPNLLVKPLHFVATEVYYRQDHHSEHDLGIAGMGNFPELADWAESLFGPGGRTS